MDKIVDINVSQTIKSVSFDITSNLITINVNKVLGGLSAVTSVNGMVGDIIGIATEDYVDNQDALKVPYTGATNNVDLGEWELKAGQIAFDQTPTQASGVAVLQWNDTDGTLDLGLKGGNVTLQLGQEQVVRIVNKTLTNLTEAGYEAVYVSGAQGQRLKVDLALATSDLTSAGTIGLVTEDIAINQPGFITSNGLIRGVNTTGSLQGEAWQDGDMLYLSPTVAGRITNVKPVAPFHTVVIGVCVYAHINQGSIFVKVDNGYELNELHNVLISEASNNDLLVYETPSNIWKNKSIPNILGYTPADDSNVVHKTGDETITGAKTFSLDTSFNGIKVGKGSGSINTNTSIGYLSLNSNTTGANNTSIGYESLKSNTTGQNNTANGYRALTSNTFGQNNTAIGFGSLYSNLSGGLNTAMGMYSMYSNTSGSGNLSIGYQALYSMLSGDNNIANGRDAGRYISGKVTEATSLFDSIMIGYRTSPLSNNQTNQIVIGHNSTGLGSNTTVLGNASTVQTWLGGRVTIGTTIDNGIDKLQVTGTISASEATLSNQVVVKSQLDAKITQTITNGVTDKSPSEDAVFNALAFKSNDSDVVKLAGTQTITGSKTFSLDSSFNSVKVGKGGGSIASNTALGDSALRDNSTGSNNTGVGLQSLLKNTTGNGNVSIGSASLSNNTSGNNNLAIGTQSMLSNTLSSSNTAIGYQTILNNTTGSNNVALGYQAGRYLNDKTTANIRLDNSILIGYMSSVLSDTQTNQIVIGHNSTGLGSNTTVLGNASTVQTWLGGRVTIGTTIDDGSTSLQVAGAISGSSTLTLLAQTASTLASFNSAKNIVSLSTATYPSLAEIAYVKGVTSSVQPQIDSVDLSLNYLDSDNLLFNAFYLRTIADGGVFESSNQLLSTMASLTSVSYVSDGIIRQINADKFVKLGGQTGEYLMANGLSLSNVATNATTTALSLIVLNNTYPLAIIGFRVHCIGITAGKLTYEKTSTGWISYSINIVI